MKNIKLNEIFAFYHAGVGILLDVQSSNFYEIDAVVYDVVDTLQKGNRIDSLYNRYSKDSINAVLNDLIKNQLFHEKEAEKLSSVNPEDVPVENVVLHLCHDCNMCCSYCFAHAGDYKGKPEYMKENVATKSLIWAIEQSGKADTLNILLFGGEPLLNVPLIKFIASQRKALQADYNKKIDINISTNGTILTDELLNFYKKNRVGIQISIDGPKHIHDEHRMFKRGIGSYDIIKKNARQILSVLPKESVIARATIAHGSVDLIGVANHLLSIGFGSVFFAPALGCGKYVLDDLDSEILMTQYSKMADLFIEKRMENKDYNVYPLRTEVFNIGKGIKRTYGCGAGLGFCSITPKGDIYPCMRFTNIPQYRIGNVNDGFDKQKRKFVAERSVDERNGCQDCWARYLCGGACVAVPAVITNDLLKQNATACLLSRHIICLAMYINVCLSRYGIQQQENPDNLDFIRRRVQ